jgi:peptide/nickel transport system substrate-binding protein
LINREFIVDEILNGYGSVQIDPFGISSPEYEALIPVLESYNFKYNPNLAQDMIEKTLISNGATKQTVNGPTKDTHLNQNYDKVMIHQENL